MAQFTHTFSSKIIKRKNIRSCIEKITRTHIHVNTITQKRESHTQKKTDIKITRKTPSTHRDARTYTEEKLPGIDTNTHSIRRKRTHTKTTRSPNHAHRINHTPPALTSDPHAEAKEVEIALALHGIPTEIWVPALHKVAVALETTPGQVDGDLLQVMLSGWTGMKQSVGARVGVFYWNFRIVG